MSKVLQQKCDECQISESELQQEIQLTQKLKRQNDLLRVNLKNISKDLDKKLQEKTKLKQIQNKPSQNQRPRVEILEEQIQNAKKQVRQYQNTLNNYHKRSKAEYTMERVNELYEEIKDKKELLKELKISEKRLQQEKRVSEQKLLTDKPEKQINILREEIMVLNNRIAQQKKQQENLTQNYESQQANIEKLTSKYQELCQQTGAQYQPIQIQSKEDLVKSNDNQKSTKEKNKKILEQYEKYQRMQQHITVLHKNQNESMKKHNQKINQLEKQILQIEEEKNKLSQSLSNKEKVLEQEGQKLRDVQHNIKQMSLLDKDSNIRKSQAGVPYASQNARSFSDSSELQIPGEFFISQVTLTSYKNFVIGLEVAYKSKKGIEKQKIGFQPKNQLENQIVQSMKLTSIEHVQNISGYYSTHIDYIKIISSRGQYIYGGNDKYQEHQQKFSIDIKKDEKPQSFFGTVDLINQEIQENNDVQELANEYVLVSIGCELKGKDLFGGNLQQKLSSYKNNSRYTTTPKQYSKKQTSDQSRNYNSVENQQQEQQNTDRQGMAKLSQKNSQQILEEITSQKQNQSQIQSQNENQSQIQSQNENQSQNYNENQSQNYNENQSQNYNENQSQNQSQIQNQSQMKNQSQFQNIQEQSNNSVNENKYKQQDEMQYEMQQRDNLYDDYQDQDQNQQNKNESGVSVNDIENNQNEDIQN